MKDGIEVGPSLFHVTQYLRTTYMIGKSADQAAMSFPSIVQGLLAPPPSHLQLSFPTCSARASSGAQFLRRRGCTALVLQAVKLCRSCQRLRRPSSTLRGGPMANSSASAVTSSLSELLLCRRPIMWKLDFCSHSSIVCGNSNQLVQQSELHPRGTVYATCKPARLWPGNC